MKFLPFLFLLTGIQINAQNKQIDSLLHLIEKHTANTEEVVCLNRLSKAYISINNYDEALVFGKQARQLAQFLHFKAGAASADSTLGAIYSNSGNYHEALKSYAACLKIKEVLKDRKGVGASFLNIGLVYMNQGSYPEALKNYFAALKMYEAIRDTYNIGISYTNIGITYYYQSDYTDALKNYEASLKIFKKIKDDNYIAAALTNIGGIYNVQGNYYKALKYHFLALRIFKKNRDEESIAISYNNIGSIYKDQGNYQEALNEHYAALHIFEKLKNITGGLSSFLSLGDTYIKMNNTKEAKKYIEKGLTLSLKIGNKYFVKNNYKYLAVLDSAMGDYKAAFEHIKLYMFYRDSIVNDKNKHQTLQSAMQYEFDKKEIAAKAEQEKLDAINAAEKKKQDYVIFFVVGVLVTVFVFSGFLFRRYRVAHKQKEIIKLQKDEVSKQKQIIEENRKEIIASITNAKRLQGAILPSASEIKKYFPDHFVYYNPKDIISGDFYWIKHLDDITFIAAADSTGHGVPGAMVSVICSNALNRAVKEFGLRDTGKILDKASELVAETFENSGEDIKDGMDISLMAFDKNKQQIYWSGANNPLWYMVNNELKEIKPDKQPIGRTDHVKPFTTHSLIVEESTVFYLFSDGYPDQFGGIKGKKLKYKPLKDLIIAGGDLPLAEQKNVLEQFFNEWKGELEQVDDVTILGVKL